MSKIRIAYSALMPDVSFMKQLCEENGIFTFEILTASHVSVAGADQGYYLEVNSEDADKVREILSNHGFEKHIIRV